MKKLFPFYLVVFLTISSAIFAQEAEDTTAVDYIPEISLDTRFGFNQSQIKAVASIAMVYV